MEGPAASRPFVIRKNGRLCASVLGASVFGLDGPAPTEAVVHSDLHGMIVVAVAGANDRRRTAGETSAAEIVVLVFRFGRPVRREHVFKAGTDGPAVLVVAVGREGDRRAGDAHPDV